MVQDSRKNVLIDGYNLIEAAPEIFTKMIDLEKRREHLLKLLYSAPHLRGTKITVVFDGRSPRGKPKKDYYHHIQVVFSGEQQEADQVIQNFIRSRASQQSLQIVSSDREIQNTARDHHAQFIEAREFWRKIRSSDQIKKKSGHKMVNHQAELSDREVQEWLKLFKQGEQEDNEN